MKIMRVKKYLLVFLLSFFTLTGLAQNCVTFKGIPVDGKLKKFVKCLKKQGFETLFDGQQTVMLAGNFAGKLYCPVIVYADDGIVNQVMVVYQEKDNWNAIYDRYSRMIELLTEKYGECNVRNEIFWDYPSSEVLSSEDKMRELRNGRCYYQTEFNVNGGGIAVAIKYDEVLQEIVARYVGNKEEVLVCVAYINFKNTDKAKRAILNDL